MGGEWDGEEERMKQKKKKKTDKRSNQGDAGT